ncbi:ATP-dependent Clp protease proteolytic subunit 2 [Striga asiatica]|uniref:ATP-dependent Clp protease proteolytic subunit 2 n=1 Tax=Striga asiatica TaxID=4170 RepID=A0A5A7RBZ3_STRAF|nr:ATP-dependent Clp protease proteolytic subunit 2 [Striga asiatica]
MPENQTPTSFILYRKKIKIMTNSTLVPPFGLLLEVDISFKFFRTLPCGRCWTTRCWGHWCGLTKVRCREKRRSVPACELLLHQSGALMHVRDRDGRRIWLGRFLGFHGSKTVFEVRKEILSSGGSVGSRMTLEDFLNKVGAEN